MRQKMFLVSAAMLACTALVVSSAKADKNEQTQ